MAPVASRENDEGWPHAPCRALGLSDTIVSPTAAEHYARELVRTSAPSSLSPPPETRTGVQPEPGDDHGLELLRAEQLHPVMRPSNGGLLEGVSHAHRVGRVHQGGDLVGVDPADGDGFGAGPMMG